MVLFPFYENIEDKTFLIVGGGSVAAEKLEKIRMFTDRIVVVAKDTDITSAKVFRKEFEAEDLELGDIVIAATSDREVNRNISLLCRESGKPCNVVDDPELCSFVFPSLVKRGKLVVSISTNGSSPAYARRLRTEIEEVIPASIEDILDRMAEFRQIVPRYVDGQKERNIKYKKILNLLIEKDNNVTDEEIMEIVKG